MHVVRCFDDSNVIHVDGSIDSGRDMETINLELIFADLETVDKRVEHCKKMSKSGDKKLLAEVNLLERIRKHLESEQPVRTMETSDDEKELIRQMFFLTSKPVIYVANIAEDDVGAEANDYVKNLYEEAAKEGAEAITVCAKLEEEIAELPIEEKKSFLEEMGIAEAGLDQLVKACYRLLGLISFLTAGPKEVRAWTIKKATRHPRRQGKFIRISKKDLYGRRLFRTIRLWNLAQCRPVKKRGLSAQKVRNMSCRMAM